MFKMIVGCLAALLVATPAAALIRINGTGASFPEPIYQLWAQEFGKSRGDAVRVTYVGSGSGAGVKAVIERTQDFGASDTALSADELKKASEHAPVLHIPTVGGAVVVIYNVPGVDAVLNLTGEVVADIYLGKISRWNDKAITDLNPGVKLPDLEIVRGTRSDGSGTTHIFTQYLGSVSDEFAEKIGVGKSPKWAAGFRAAPQNAGVTNLVRETPGAIGYVELNYATANKLAHAAIKNKTGEFVKASVQSVSAASTAAAERIKRRGVTASLLNVEGKAVYPISGHTFVLVYKDLKHLDDEAKARELVAFLRWITSDDGQKIAASMHYAPISKELQATVKEMLDGIQFNGKALK